MDAIRGGRVGLGAVHTTVAGVLLAAGEGSRFGRPKALVELDGQTLAARGVNVLRTGGADPILVVIGAAQVNLDGIHTVYNEQWRTGMGSSLRAALRALTDAEGAEGAEGPQDRTAATLPVDVGGSRAGGPAPGRDGRGCAADRRLPWRSQRGRGRLRRQAP